MDAGVSGDNLLIQRHTQPRLIWNRKVAIDDLRFKGLLDQIIYIGNTIGELLLNESW